MRKLASVLALGFLSVPTSAQSDYPRAELFGGFSFGSIEVKDPVGNTFGHEAAEGFQAAIAVNVNRTLGIVADFGGAVTFPARCSAAEPVGARSERSRFSSGHGSPNAWMVSPCLSMPFLALLSSVTR